MLGKVQHDAAVLLPEIQVHELLRSSAYDRALTLSRRFHFSSALTTAQAKQEGQNFLRIEWTYHGGNIATIVLQYFLRMDHWPC
jgi:hypothetical protein